MGLKEGWTDKGHDTQGTITVYFNVDPINMHVPSYSSSFINEHRPILLNI